MAAARASALSLYKVSDFRNFKDTKIQQLKDAIEGSSHLVSSRRQQQAAAAARHFRSIVRSYRVVGRGNQKSTRSPQDGGTASFGARRNNATVQENSVYEFNSVNKPDDVEFNQLDKASGSPQMAVAFPYRQSTTKRGWERKKEIDIAEAPPTRLCVRYSLRFTELSRLIAPDND